MFLIFSLASQFFAAPKKARAMLFELPLDVLAHILSVERLPDPVDLARLQAANHAMRYVVA